jgi:hypothetical protein
MWIVYQALITNLVSQITYRGTKERLLSNEMKNMRKETVYGFERLRITMKYIRQDTWASGRNLNPLPLGYEAGTLLTGPNVPYCWIETTETNNKDLPVP